jgi:hypothetical protein
VQQRAEKQQGEQAASEYMVRHGWISVSCVNGSMAAVE